MGRCHRRVLHILRWRAAVETKEFGINPSSSYLESVIRPWAKLHEAGLHIKGIVANIDFTWRFKNRRGCPFNFPITSKYSFCHGCDHVLSISTGKYHMSNSISINFRGPNTHVSNDKRSRSWRQGGKRSYLLYKTISGSQMCSDGTYSSVTPPYSLGSHWNLWSSHSCPNWI